MAEKKRFLWGIASAALVFVVGLVACDNGTTPEDEPPKSETTGDETELETYQSAGLYVNDAETPEPGISGLDEAFAWIRANAEDDGSYTIVLDEDTTVAGNRAGSGTAAFYLDSAEVNEKTGVTITLLGLDEERTIELSSAGVLFSIDGAVRLILGNNIILKGLKPNARPLVYLYNFASAELQMLAGSKITGNGSIAVRLLLDDVFIMKGGEIYDNEGSGVQSRNGSFTMSGGEIYGNQLVVPATVANFGGGGVGTLNLVSGSTFRKTGGVIYGYNPNDPKSNKVIKNGEVQTDRGSAVVYYSDSFTLKERREATASANNEMDSTKSGTDGGWL